MRLGLSAALVLWLGVSVSAQLGPAAPEELFRLYQQREYDVVERQLAAVPSFKTFAKSLALQSRDWPLRQRAAFQLEAAASAYAASVILHQMFTVDTGTVIHRQVQSADRQRLVRASFDTYIAAGEMLEAACGAVRTLPATDPFARDWQLAALALLQGVGDPNWLGPSRGGVDLRQHIGHLKGRLEPGRLLLAEALTYEEIAWQLLTVDLPTAAGGHVFGDNILVTQLHTRLRQSTAEALSLLEGAAKYPEFAPEATLHKAALLHLRSQGTDLEVAFALLRGLAAEDGHADAHTYLVHLLLGRVMEELGHRREAEAAYRKASEILPTAQAARLSLAALEYVRGDAASAHTAIDTLFDQPLESPDPWTLFTRGEFGQWRLRLIQVRRHPAAN